MKKCPACAEEIQDKAIKCKHCGKSLKKSNWAWWVLGIWILIIICAHSSKPTSSSSSDIEKPFTIDRSEAITYAEQFVEENLGNYNHDYQFPYDNTPLFGATQNADGSWTVHSIVKFINSYQVVQDRFNITLIADPKTKKVNVISSEILGTDPTVDP